MADKKITDLDPIVTVQPATLLVVVDVAGTPTDKQATVSQLQTAIVPPVPFAVASGGTGAATLAAHSVLVGAGATPVAVIAPGTTGQVLTSRGATLDPTFQAAVPSYIEGVFTPTIIADGSASGQVYAVQQGAYVKVGKLVTASFQLVLSNKGTLTGNVFIGSLPFTASMYATCAINWTNTATAFANIIGITISGTVQISLRGNTAASTTNNGDLQGTDILNNTTFYGSVSYFN
jgi:hypothetical protein